MEKKKIMIEFDDSEKKYSNPYPNTIYIESIRGNHLSEEGKNSILDMDKLSPETRRAVENKEIGLCGLAMGKMWEGIPEEEVQKEIEAIKKRMKEAGMEPEEEIP